MLKKIAAGAAALCVLASGLHGRLLRVPADYVSLKAAVYAAQAGDVIEVEDGVYFEENIPVTKRLTIRARHPYAAVIYGRTQIQGLSCVFLIQAEAEIEGFILKNSRFGILQRSSPDVAWSAHDLAILNMSQAAIAINEKARTSGRATVERVLIDNCSIGFQTDDAHSLSVRRSLVADCGTAFSGCNHRSFQVEGAWIWNCGTLVREDDRAPAWGATNRITLGRNVAFLNGASIRQMGQLSREADIIRALDHLRVKAKERGFDPRSQDILRGLMNRVLGDLSAKAGKSDQALTFYRQALQIGQRQNFPELVWPAQQGLANVFRSTGRAQEAMDAYQNAIREVEGLRQDLAFKLYNPGYLEDKIRLYESLIGLLYELHLRHPGRGYERLAFEYSERSKAQGLIQSLREADLIRLSGAAGSFRYLEKLVIRRLEALQSRLQSPELGSRQRAALLVELDKAWQNLKSLFLLMRSKAPEFSRLPQAEAYSLEDIRARVLDEHSLLVEYFLGETQSFAFGLTREKLAFVRLGPPQAISSLTDRFLRYLSLRNDGRDAAGSRRLYRILLAPFTPLLAEANLKIFIVPDGKLHYLPFEALTVEGPGIAAHSPGPRASAGRFVVEDYEVLYIPSASTLLTIKDRPQRPPGPMEFLGVANSRMNGLREIAFPLASPLPPLKYAQREVETAASFFPKDKVLILRGEPVEEGAFLKLPLGQFRIIHFATHGLFDDRNWLYSCLLLDRDHRGDYDGFLQPSNIYLLDLNADLVVLSACHTGLGRLEKGDGLAGLAWTFLYAGAKSFLCSLWSVNDRTSVQFMKTFYAQLLSGRSPGTALREAKLSLLRRQRLAPFYWAGFVLICGTDGFLGR